MTLLWKLLRSHLSVAQTVGFALAGVVGMTIVLTSVQAYRDVMPVFDAPDSFMRGDYLVLSKRVGALQTIGLGSSDFTPAELEELKEQPFVRDVGAFTPADYRVKGTVGMGGVQLSTYLFFEAVPDRFLDVASGKWKYEPGDGDIPIIIPRNYLNLYNYGFAKSQGLPQISEGIFQRVSLGIEVAGNGRTEQFRGRIRSSSRSLSSAGRTGGSARAGRNRHRGSSSRPTALSMPRFRLTSTARAMRQKATAVTVGRLPISCNLRPEGSEGWDWCSA